MFDPKAPLSVMLYLKAKEAILRELDGLPEDQRDLYLLASQIAWNDVALEQLGSAVVCGIYDGAIETLESAAPSRVS